MVFVQDEFAEFNSLFDSLNEKLERFKILKDRDNGGDYTSLPPMLRYKFENLITDLGLYNHNHKKTLYVTTKDLTSLDYKDEIRNVISDMWFNQPFDDLKSNYSLFCDDMSLDTLNKKIETLKTISFDGFNSLYSYVIPGIGPGELVIYFLVDDVVLGGGSSSSVDIISKHGNFEVKAVKPTQHKILGSCLSDFKLGGTVSLNETILRLKKLCKIETNEIPGSIINSVRTDLQFQVIENEYRKHVADYFSDHNVIFFNHKVCKSHRGKIISIGNVKYDNIFLERVTSGTVKPLIKY